MPQNAFADPRTPQNVFADPRAPWIAFEDTPDATEWICGRCRQTPQNAFADPRAPQNASQNAFADDAGRRHRLHFRTRRRHRMHLRTHGHHRMRLRTPRRHGMHLQTPPTPPTECAVFLSMPRDSCVVFLRTRALCRMRCFSCLRPPAPPKPRRPHRRPWTRNEKMLPLSKSNGKPYLVEAHAP